MPIRFPPADDVTLDTPPLTEVMCQVRFAPILSIGEKNPSKFQKPLRQRFPRFTARAPLRLELVGGTPQSGVPLPIEYVFSTADEQTSVVLASNFLALSTTTYQHWTSFEADLALVLDAFVKAYGTVLATRIGLRYINALTHKNTGTSTLDELVTSLTPDLTHLYSNAMWYPPDGTATLVTAREGTEIMALRVSIEGTPEARITLDFDYYQEFEQPEAFAQSDLLEKLRRYHQSIYRAFRWSIQKQTFESFGPEGGSGA